MAEFSGDESLFKRLFHTAAETWSLDRRRNLAAAVVLDRQLLSVGGNSFVKTHPLQARFAKNKDAIFLHAEINAIARASREAHWRGLEFKKAEIYVARVKTEKRGAPLRFCMAAPCSGCRAAIVEFGFSKVHFTNEEGLFETVEI